MENKENSRNELREQIMKAVEKGFYKKFDDVAGYNFVKEILREALLCQ